jgi:hypothetical protein
MSEPCIEDYTIGWICALQEEFEAACRMLDVLSLDRLDGVFRSIPMRACQEQRTNR